MNKPDDKPDDNLVSTVHEGIEDRSRGTQPEGAGAAQTKTVEEFAAELAPIYETERWGWWSGASGGLKIPDKARIAAEIRACIDELKRGNSVVQCGGLVVIRKGQAFSVIMNSRKHGNPTALIQKL